MDEGCTCHLGHPPCGYCTDGTEGFQEALGFAQGLDDNELDRLRGAIDDIRAERAEERGAKPKAAAQIAPPPKPVAIVVAHKPDLTPRQRVAQIAVNLGTLGRREKARAAMVKAMAIPTDEKPWKEFDAADRAYYEPTNLGPRGEGGEWDNRCRRGR